MLLAEARDEDAKEGLSVNLVRTPGRPLVRDNLLNGNYDASHLLLGLPLTMSLDELRLGFESFGVEKYQRYSFYRRRLDSDD